MADMTDEKLEFIQRAVHRLYCSPAHAIVEGGCGDKKADSIGRIHYHHDLAPEYRGPECVCHTRTIRYNGVVIFSGTTAV